MPARDELITIGDLAARSGVAASALRFYEARGLIRSERTGGGQRRFPRAALRRVALIRIAQGLGLSLAEVGRALEALPEERIATRQDWIRLSSSWRRTLELRIDALTRLRDTLTGCIGCGCLSLRRCALYNPADRVASRGTGPRYLVGDPSPEPVGAAAITAARATRA